MAFAFIGEAVASGIIGKVAEAAYTAVQENLLPAGNIEEELERLQRTLPRIQAVLSAIESGEINNHNRGLTGWMWQFRDVVEYAEDVLDEMSYYEIEEKIQKHNKMVGPSTSGLKRKLNSFANTMLKADNHGILKKLAKAVKGLDEVASSVHNFLYLLGGPGIRFHGKISENKNVENDRETGSMMTEAVVFGRENERDFIVEWLIVNPSIGGVTLSAFTIYGIGGMGKTTLAQLIYNDERVKQFFDTIIWVCVSDQFDVAKIIAKILEFMSKKSPKVSSLTVLQNILKEQLRSKKFLLVLDDVWNDENRFDWEKLVAPLKFGHGKILLTTRMESVGIMAAKVIEGKISHLKLDGLEEEEFFMLLKKHAFDGVNADEFINLHLIGKQIAKKLGGCPLAAKIMGGVLNYSMEFEYWNKIQKEDVPNFQEAKDGIMDVLKLSYCHLPVCLQVCFRYCSIFSKDYKFSKNELIKMWMGSGLIEPSCKRQMLEDVGRDYLNRFVRKSFLDLKQDNRGRDYYVMHDLLHDLAQSVSKDECLRIEGNSSNVPRTIRHLGFNTESIPAISEISHLKNLRTLFIQFVGDNPDSDNIQIFREVLERLKCLRLLRITVTVTEKGCFKIPDMIGELIHLRYLSHESNSWIEELPWFPISVYKLYHLEVIIFSRNAICMEEPDVSGMHNLIKLRHLDVGFEIWRIIPFIGKLTFLHDLTFCIRPENGHTIIELRDLRNLHKLGIFNLNEVSNPAEANEAKLNEKEYLNSLVLSWSNLNHGSPSVEMYEQLADNLEPPINLQEFSVNGYDGMRCPTWMTYLYLRNLIHLELSNCSHLTSVPALGKFSLLERLEMYQLPNVRKIDHNFYGNDIEFAFPVLKKLTISELPELQDWDEIQGITLFPRLKLLRISNCPKLRKLPSLPPSLKELRIYDVGLEILPRIYPINNNGIISKSSLSNLYVSECPDLITLDGCLLEHAEVMQMVKISNCDKLITTMSLSQPPLSINANHSNQLQLNYLNVDRASLLLLEPLRSLRFTRQLFISNASGLTCMPEEWLLQNQSSLREIVVWRATSLEHLPSCMDKLRVLKKLQILNAPLIQSLPDLPPSLNYLHITGCHPVLKERYETDLGPEWHKIASISFVGFR